MNNNQIDIREKEFVDAATAQIKENPTETLRDYMGTIHEMQRICDNISADDIHSNENITECIEEINAKGIIDIDMNNHGDFAMKAGEMKEALDVQRGDFNGLFSDLCENLGDKLMSDPAYATAKQYAQTLAESDKDFQRTFGVQA